jgi:hypothetical protein
MLKPALSTLALAASLGITSCADLPVQPDPRQPGATRSAPAPRPAFGQHIADEYIVFFNDNVRDVPGLTKSLTQLYADSVLYTYEGGPNGFAAKMPRAAAEALLRNPNVKYVEPNKVMQMSAWQSPAPWNLDRIDERYRPTDGRYGYSQNGAGVNAYVIDSGIRTDLGEFGGRARVGFDAIGGNGQDCTGHGTQVASVIGGATQGVAKAVNLIGIRVAHCDGSVTEAAVIRGINWVRVNHRFPAVANMSILGPRSSTMDDAVRALIAAGVTFVTVAGNNVGQDACNYSPSRVSEAITVGSSTDQDARAAHSNVGPCVDIFAPGEGVSTINLYGVAVPANGTSFAAPHVAGFAALEQSHNYTDPAVVARVILADATRDVLSDIGTGSPNLLLFSNPYSIDPLVRYRAHVDHLGWQADVLDGHTAGTVGQSLSMQALDVRQEFTYTNYGILKLEVYASGIGWMGEQFAGSGIAGTVGESRPLEAVRLYAPTADAGHSVCYQVHIAYDGWLPEVCDWTVAGKIGEGKPIQAIRIRFVRPM